MNPLPRSNVIPLSPIRLCPEGNRKRRERTEIGDILKTSHRLNYRHVQLMQSKVRCKEGLQRRFGTGRTKSAVDEAVTAAGEDIPLREFIEVCRWESTPKVSTPTITSPFKPTHADSNLSRYRKTAHSNARSPVQTRPPLSVKAKEIGKIFAPLSRRIIPGSVARRRVSTPHFTLENFYPFPHSQHSSRLESYS